MLHRTPKCFTLESFTQSYTHSHTDCSKLQLIKNCSMTLVAHGHEHLVPPCVSKLRLSRMGCSKLQFRCELMFTKTIRASWILKFESWYVSETNLLLSIIMGRLFKLKYAVVLYQYLFFLTFTNAVIFHFIRIFLWAHYPVSSITLFLLFCPLCSFKLVYIWASFFSFSASSNPRPYLNLSPAWQPVVHLPCCPVCLFFSVSSPQSPLDGIIHVILSHYWSSDANSCTANIAAGKAGPMPKFSGFSNSCVLLGHHASDAQGDHKAWHSCWW